MCSEPVKLTEVTDKRLLKATPKGRKILIFANNSDYAYVGGVSTGGPDVVFDSSADKTMYENTLNIALNRTCIKDLNENVLHYVYLTLF